MIRLAGSLVVFVPAHGGIGIRRIAREVAMWCRYDDQDRWSEARRRIAASQSRLHRRWTPSPLISLGTDRQKRRLTRGRPSGEPNSGTDRVYDSCVQAAAV